MTEMKRITEVFPEEIDRAVYELKKEDRVVKCSYAEIIRQLAALSGPISGGVPATLTLKFYPSFEPLRQFSGSP